MMTDTLPVFDGHNDFLLRLLKDPANRDVTWLQGNGKGHLLWMERASNGAFKVCRTAAELRDCLARSVISGIMHLEGAEPIGADLDALYTFHAMGLRSIGPVWSRPTVFGHGVPFRFPPHVREVVRCSTFPLFLRWAG